MDNNKGRVLIVDDTPANIKILGTLLKEDHNVLVANSGIRAIEVANSDPKPDVILLDIMMPEMDGYEVCQRLKENSETKDIPVIFLTAMSEGEDEDKGLSLGACDYITKPFNANLVRSRVDMHVKLKKCMDLIREVAKELPEDIQSKFEQFMS